MQLHGLKFSSNILEVAKSERIKLCVQNTKQK